MNKMLGGESVGDSISTKQKGSEEIIQGVTSDQGGSKEVASELASSPPTTTDANNSQLLQHRFQLGFFQPKTGNGNGNGYNRLSVCSAGFSFWGVPGIIATVLNVGISVLFAVCWGTTVGSLEPSDETNAPSSVATASSVVLVSTENVP